MSLTETSPPNDQNKRQRVDIALIPYDDSLQNATLINSTSFIPLRTLERENLNPSSRTYIDAMLLRIIPPSSSSNDSRLGSLRMYGPKGKISSTAFYSRLFLCKVFSHDENQRLFYLMENKSTNNLLWKRNTQLRDDGTITIGTIFRIMAPLPIKNLMSGDLPMVETRYPVVVMRFPEDKIPLAKINHSIEGNSALAFVQDEVNLQIHSTTPEETKCAGLFCDKQRIHEIANQNRGCGCYHMLNRRCNIVFDHWIRLRAKDIDLIVEHFSSTSFSQYYLSECLPGSVRLSSLQMTESFFNLLTAIDAVVDYINNHGGWTVVGWYKRGVVNDKTLTDNMPVTKEEAKVDSGELTYHVVFLKPTNNAFEACDTDLGKGLKEKKFDVSKFEDA